MIFDHKVLRYKGQVVFGRFSIPTFQRIPKLFQNDEACFMFINEGEFSIRTPDEFISLSKGKALLAKCFDYFFETSEQQRKNSNGFEGLGILLPANIVEELFQFNVSSSKYTLDYNIKEVQLDGLLNHFKESINILIDNPELADEAIIRNKLKEFVLLISKTQNAPSHLDFMSALFKTNAMDFKTTINSNLYSSLSVDEFAKLCGMSTSSFKRKFQEIYQESPKKYISKMKLQKASEMLKSNDYRISDIAYDCGYETISTFNRAFKSFFEKSPTEYRLTENA